MHQLAIYIQIIAEKFAVLVYWHLDHSITSRNYMLSLQLQHSRGYAGMPFNETWWKITRNYFVARHLIASCHTMKKKKEPCCKIHSL